jgi:hypothetical protein
VSEQGDQFEEREQEGQGDALGSGQDGGTSGSTEGVGRENRGDRSSGETPPSRGDLPSEEDRKEETQQGNRESGTDESGAQQGDVAHEGDLPTEAVPEAD